MALYNADMVNLQTQNGKIGFAVASIEWGEYV